MRKVIVPLLLAAGAFAGEATVPTQHLKSPDGTTDLTITQLPPDSSNNSKAAVSGTINGKSVSGSGGLRINPDGSWTAIIPIKPDGDGGDILPGKDPKVKLNANPDDEDDGDDSDDQGGSVEIDKGGGYGKGSIPLMH